MSHTFFKRLGLENLVDPQDPQIPEAGNSEVENALLNANSVAADISKNNVQVDSLTEDGETLEEVKVALESAIKNGNPASLRSAIVFAKLNHSAISRRYKIQRAPRPSMESLEEESDDSLEDIANASLEEINSFVGDLWRSITGLIAGIGRKIKEWWAFTSDALKAIRSRAEGVKKQISDMDFSGGQELKFNEGGLYLGGHAPSAEEMSKSLAYVYETGLRILDKEGDKAFDKAQDIIVDAISKVVAEQRNGQIGMMVEAAGAFETALVEYAGFLTAAKPERVRGEDGADILEYNTLSFLGDRMIFCRSSMGKDARRTMMERIEEEMEGPREVDENGNQIEGSSILDNPMYYIVHEFDLTIRPTNRRSFSGGSREFIGASKAEAIRLLDQILEVCNHIAGYHAAFMRRDQVQQKIIDRIRSIMDARPPARRWREENFLRGAARASVELWRTVLEFNMEYIGYMLTTSKYLIDYVRVSAGVK